MASRGNERRRFVLNHQQAQADRAKWEVPEQFRAFVVDHVGEAVHAGLQDLRPEQLPAGDVLIRVTHSSVNYKDAMAATGHRGIVKKWPHVPGIDAAGIVVQSDDPSFQPGDEVIATGREIGVERWGAWSEYARIPAGWVQPVPEGLSRRDAMILGTAGFTAAQCVAALLDHGIGADAGEIAVTGATGGVGVIAVRLLARLGFTVVAVTGKASQAGWLVRQGATRVVERERFVETSSRPLLSAQWAGAVDTVGGPVLATLVRSMKHRGCVAACGVVGGAELPMSVYPFILRGVTLAGIDSAWCPDDRRREIWRRLGAEWRLEGLDALCREISLDEIEQTVSAMLRGEALGRTVINLESE